MPAARKNNPLGLPPRVYFKHMAFFFVDMQNKWHRLGPDWNFEARAKWNSLISESPQESRLSVSDLIEAYIAHRTPNVTESTIEDFGYSKANLIPVFGTALPDQLTPPMIQKYLDKTAQEDRATRGNREIALLSAAYNFAIPRGLATVNPCSRVERNPEKPRTRRVTLQELDTFVAWCFSDKTDGKLTRHASREEKLVAVSCELLFLCAQSKKDMLKVKRGDIDDEGIHVIRGKTGVRVCIGWSPRLRAAKARMLDLQKDTVSGLYLICTRLGRKYSEHGWSSLFHRVMNDYIAQGGERFSPHDMRAAGATALLENNETASNTTGHRLESTLKKHYDRRLERKGKPAA
jgi:integrase